MPSTSPIISARKAIERRLNTLVPSLPAAYENTLFTPPNDSAYLRIQYRVQSPDDPVFNKFYYREKLEGQIFVCDQLNIGSANAFSIAEKVRELFDKGTFMQEDGYRIYVLTTPHIAGSAITTDRFVVPVLIDFIIEVER